MNGGTGAAGRRRSQGRLLGGGWRDRWASRAGVCLAGAPALSLQLCPEFSGPELAHLGLRSGGIHSMAQRAAAAPLSSEGEQRGRPQPAKLLPCPAALCHPAGAGVPVVVVIAAWRPRRMRCSWGTAGGWRAHQLGLARLRGPAPRLSPSPPVWT